MVLDTCIEATDLGSGCCDFDLSHTQDPTLIFLHFLTRKDRNYVKIMS